MIGYAEGFDLVVDAGLRVSWRICIRVVKMPDR